MTAVKAFTVSIGGYRGGCDGIGKIREERIAAEGNGCLPYVSIRDFTQQARFWDTKSTSRDSPNDRTFLSVPLVDDSRESFLSSINCDAVVTTTRVSCPSNPSSYAALVTTIPPSSLFVDAIPAGTAAVINVDLGLPAPEGISALRHPLNIVKFSVAGAHCKFLTTPTPLV